MALELLKRSQWWGLFLKQKWLTGKRKLKYKCKEYELYSILRMYVRSLITTLPQE